MLLGLMAAFAVAAPRLPALRALAIGSGGATRRTASPVAAAAADDGDAGPLLFLVDDQPGMRSAVERYLSQRGFRCRAFESAMDALNALGTTSPPPDALVTDVLMPGGMDGLELLRSVRADARLCAVPVVLLTARGLTADRIAGYDAGCSAYVAKPFDPEELVAVLRALTSNAVRPPQPASLGATRAGSDGRAR
jgi:DNA-binding response OmpR family regulator